MIRGYFRHQQPALLLVLLLVLGSASSLYGQALKGTILGTVTDLTSPCQNPDFGHGRNVGGLNRGLSER